MTDLSQAEKKECIPEWVKCIRGSEGKTFCGRASRFAEWIFEDAEHAESALDCGTRIQPCGTCLVNAILYKKARP